MNINENQTLKFCCWLCGFIDGEGCFSVSCRFRQRNKVGIEIQPSFSVAQKRSQGHYNLLKQIRDFFDTGSIRSDQNCYKYETRNLKEIIEKVIPFFKNYPLKTDKQNDFQIFATICSRMEKKEHLNEKGLIIILESLESMNISGKKRYSIRELIDSFKSDKPLNFSEKEEITL